LQFADKRNETKRNYDHAGSISICTPLGTELKIPEDDGGNWGFQGKWKLTAAVRDLQNLHCKMQKLHPLGIRDFRGGNGEKGKSAACLRVKSRRKCAFNSSAAWAWRKRYSLQPIPKGVRPILGSLTCKVPTHTEPPTHADEAFSRGESFLYVLAFVAKR